jgi:beta-glucosidase
VNAFQEYALATRLGIPLIYGVDAVHGHGNLRGATIFPHNIGLGAANDPDLVEAVCRATAEEMVATGIYWNYAPVLAVVQDVRWGRTYESYSENTERVTALGTACIRGLQGDDLSDPTTVLATPKHYIGDGATTWGTSTIYAIDQGVMETDEATLRQRFLPPYQVAIEAGAMSVMISFSSWNETKMHAQSYLITDVLKGELGFRGFVVSDWGGIDQISPDYYDAVVTSINAGVDMNMVPYDYRRFIGVMLDAVENGDISLERIDDAVRRILRAKFELGLFEWPYSQEQLLPSVGSDEHRQLARQAVAQSLVLLKNEDAALPLSKDTPVVFVAGEAADDIGMQSGGWTIEWQGKTGDITPGTTILEAVQNTLSAESTLYYDPFGHFEDAQDASGNSLQADVAIVVIGEPPYAEGLGDSPNLTLPPGDIRALERAAERADKVVVILLNGRPVIINRHLELADAFVVAWLPGTEGQGVADVIFGDQPFTGTLPFTWMAEVDQLPLDPVDDAENPLLFPYGFGLK